MKHFQPIKEPFNPFSVMNKEQRRLRKVVSDVSWKIDKYIDTSLETLSSTSTTTVLELEDEDDQVNQAECECCGLKEDCTSDYIKRVKGHHCGKFVCGLCSEAVNEMLYRAHHPKVASMEDAVSSQREFCQKFNSTTRLNPKLSLTFAMRDIAKRSYESRSSHNLVASNKIGRSTSCVPKIYLKKHSMV